MKISNKGDLQQIAFNHSADNVFENYKSFQKCTAKPYSFLVIDNTLASENSLCFRNNLLERI